MGSRHQIDLDGEDYDRLRARFGASWARNARRLLSKALDGLDSFDGVAQVQIAHLFGPLLTDGPRKHERFGWYVRVQLPGDVTIRQIRVYAREDTRTAAHERAREVLALLGLEHWIVHSHDAQFTSRGNDIETRRKPEGIA